MYLVESKIKLNKFYHDDCRNLMQLFPRNFIDLTITSPPYDCMRKYSSNQNWNLFTFRDIADHLYRITKPGGILVWVVGDQTRNGSESLTSLYQALHFKALGFWAHDTMIYEKANFSNPSSNRYHQIFEYMFVFSKGKPKTFNPICDKPPKYDVPLGIKTVRQVDGSQKEVKKKTPKKSGMRSNIWRMKTAGQEKMCKSIHHPAKFPDQLARDHILSWSNPGDLVFDPMAGSGTTLKEAEKLDRKWIGCEIEQEYVDEFYGTKNTN